MLYELKKNEFYKCKSLVNENGHLEVKAIVEGNNPGRIFVDNKAAPQTGLIWFGNLDGFAFIGNPNNESFNQYINRFIDDVIAPEAKKLGLEWFEGLGNDQAWNKTIERLFKHRQFDVSNQNVYTLQKEKYRFENEPFIADEYEIKKITKEMIISSCINNLDFLLRTLTTFWASPQAFFEKGIGYCVMYQNEIVSICYSGFTAGNVHCIGIETLKEHRGKKLAQKLAHVFVKDCLQHSFVPYWDCMEVNIPSNIVAEKIGFSNLFHYKVYEFPFK